MLNDEIKIYLENLDREQEALTSCHGEYAIANKIRNILKKDANYKPTIEDIAEQAAFDFWNAYSNDWGTYYGPLSIWENQEGQRVAYPDIKEVNEEILKYWAKRAKESKYPILSSRYADLVVDFSPKVINEDADVDLFQIVIDSNIAICKRSLVRPLDCEKKIERALALAVQINNQGKIAKVKETIINLEEKTVSWSFAFKLLIFDFRKKITLAEAEKMKLVKALEDRLERVKTNVWWAEKAVLLLAEYYANEKDEDNLMRVLDVLEKSLKTDHRINSDALLKVHAYEKIHEIYQKYRDKGFSKATDASKRISQEMGQLDLDLNKSLKEISVTTEVEQKDIDAFLKAIFGDKEQSELEVIIARIAINFLPKKEALENELKDISEKHPMQFLSTTKIISGDRMPIATLSPLKEDHDNHLQHYASQYIQFASFSLALASDELKKRISKQNITEYFRNSMLFENEDKEYLERAISAYWDNDYLASSHLFSPLIESAIRELVKSFGGTVLKPNSLGGYGYLTLGSLLKELGNIIEKVSSEMDQNVVFHFRNMIFYFRLVLTEQLGMNLRNDFAHGFGKRKFFTRDVSDRLFHVMACLASGKKREENK